MQKEQLINWIANIIRKNILPSTEKYELESKIGKFIGKNIHSKRYIDQIHQLQQLNKNECQFEFQSRISQSMFDKAFEYFKEQDVKITTTLRLDFAFNTKEQRSSIYLDDEKNCSGILIEKKKKLTQHMDIVNKDKNYRISLNLEKTLSTSLKDILAQMPQRAKSIGFIRLKETNYIVKDNLEYALSKVNQINKSKCDFHQIINIILSAKYFNIKTAMEDLFKEKMKDIEYELEIEIVQNPNLKEEDISQLATLFLDKTECLADYVVQKDEKKIIEKNDNDIEQIEKKVKINEK